MPNTTSSRAPCRQRQMMAVELGIMMRVATTPVILAAVRTPSVVRDAIRTAIAEAQSRGDVAS